MSLKIIEHTEQVTNTLKFTHWVVYVDNIEIAKFNSYKEALNYSVQHYGHSTVFST